MRLAASMVLVASVCAAGPAAAQIDRDAARVVQSLAGRGAAVTRLAPRFVEQDRVAAFVVDLDRLADGCTNVLFIGSRTLDFWVGPLDDVLAARAAAEPDPQRPRGDTDDGGRVRSSAGVAVISRCGPDQGELARLGLEMRSARGAIEVVVARTKQRLGAATELLPERDNGPSAPRGDPGGAIEPGPVEERTLGAERRARAEGAASIRRLSHKASAQGNGTVVIELEEGCHRLTMMAAIPKVVPRRATDLDAMARDPIGGRLLARDRSEAPDALLELCLGEPTAVEVSFAGASGPADITTVDAVWPVPKQVPGLWGARARAGFAWSLWRRHVPALDEPPVFQSLGVSGATSFAVPVEPGRCYVAAVALIRGEGRGTRLSVDVAERSLRDEAAPGESGGAVAFCSETDTVVRTSLEIRGGTPWWAFALWELGGVAR